MEVDMDVFIISPFDFATEPCIVTQAVAKTSKFRTVEIEGLGVPKDKLQVGKSFYMRAESLELKEDGAERLVNTSPIKEMSEYLNVVYFQTESGSHYMVQYTK
ncbi:MAG: hypothetical protein EOP48_14345 [Sphingobacteriales bacterium]|nr:MAG: hypothetical protein EOP48_14345 [Sphingobacteriales bacterium]